MGVNVCVVVFWSSVTSDRPCEAATVSIMGNSCEHMYLHAFVRMRGCTCLGTSMADFGGCRFEEGDATIASRSERPLEPA